MLIAARNKRVKEGLRKAYGVKVPGGDLKVFCVSNKTYEKFSRKGEVEYVEASGIPELRSFCHSITAQAQFAEANHFLHTSLPGLLNSAKLWSEQNHELATSRGIQDQKMLLEAMENLRQSVITC